MPGTKWTPPGERRRQIIIQQESTAKNTGGFLSGTWTNVATTWASIVPRVSKSAIAIVDASNQPIVRMYYEVNIRYIPGLTILPGMRIVEQASSVSGAGATYVIQAVMDVEERHRELSLFCTQVPATAAETQ